MRKWLKIKAFPKFLFIALYLRISWFCKVVHHFSTTNKVIYIGTGRYYHAYKQSLCYAFEDQYALHAKVLQPLKLIR